MRDTRSLSLAEHGAYTLLLDNYYATGQPLENDIAALFRVCGAQTDEERAAIRKIAELFFPMNGDGHRHNKRADHEIAKAEAISAERSRVGKLGGRPRRRKHLQSNCLSKTEAIATTSTSTSTGEQPEPKPDREPARPRAPRLSDADWMSAMVKTYSAMGIDVAREDAKCRAWCATKQRNFSRATFVNWLNRADSAIKPGGKSTRTMIPSEDLP
jgi:uncharacterized protein YdaU (DUF1376 family)